MISGLGATRNKNKVFRTNPLPPPLSPPSEHPGHPPPLHAHAVQHGGADAHSAAAAAAGARGAGPEEGDVGPHLPGWGGGLVHLFVLVGKEGEQGPQPVIPVTYINYTPAHVIGRDLEALYPFVPGVRLMWATYVSWSAVMITEVRTARRSRRRRRGRNGWVYI